MIALCTLTCSRFDSLWRKRCFAALQLPISTIAVQWKRINKSKIQKSDEHPHKHTQHIALMERRHTPAHTHRSNEMKRCVCLVQHRSEKWVYPSEGEWEWEKERERVRRRERKERERERESDREASKNFYFVGAKSRKIVYRRRRHRCLALSNIMYYNLLVFMYKLSISSE